MSSAAPLAIIAAALTVLTCHTSAFTYIDEFGNTITAVPVQETLPNKSSPKKVLTAVTNPAVYDLYLLAAAKETRVDANLLRAIIWIESRWDPRARSPKGACGLMQLMPQTAQRLGVDVWNAEQNIRGGAKYLAALLDQFGDPSLALAAYNAGEAAVEQYHGIPPYPETRRYVRDVASAYRVLAAI